MRNTLLTLLLLAGPVIAAPAPAAPASAPATRPDALSPPPPPPGAMLDRVRDAVDELALTPEQKTKIAAIFKEARGELEQMKTQLESMELRDRLAETRDFLEGLRADLAFVLTPPQREQLQQKIEQMRQSAPAMPPPGLAPERLRQALPKLKLSNDQAAKVKEFFDDLRPRADALRQQAEMGDAAAREKLRELGQETREKLRAILTPEQQDKLRDLMRQPPPEPGNAGNRRGRNNPNASTRAATRAAKGDAASDQMSEMTMSSTGGDTMTMEGASGGRRDKSAGTAAPAADPEKLPPGPAIGDAAPEFTLTKTDGAQVQLSSLKGRVVVLVFGSYSAPTFRNRAAAMEKLRGDFGTRATFFVVYSREAYPTGEWEIARNKEDGISVEQARSLDARKSAATTAREKLKMATPILLDTIGNDTALAYGAGVNSAYVIGRDGTIAARQQWFEPLALRRALDAATATAAAPIVPLAPAKPATKPAN